MPFQVKDCPVSDSLDPASCIRVRRAATRNDLFERVSVGRNIIDQNIQRSRYGTAMYVSTLAAESAMSPFHFSRIFKQAFGMSPYQYILTKRLEQAAILLRGGSLPVCEIAATTGFVDLYTFSKAFKRKFGVAPSLYRSRYDT